MNSYRLSLFPRHKAWKCTSQHIVNVSEPATLDSRIPNRGIYPGILNRRQVFESVARPLRSPAVTARPKFETPPRQGANFSRANPRLPPALAVHVPAPVVNHTPVRVVYYSLAVSVVVLRALCSAIWGKFPARCSTELTCISMCLHYKEMRGSGEGVTSEVMRERVVRARAPQKARGYYNALLPPGLLRKIAALDDAGERTLEMAVRRLGLSARAHDRILKVARTIRIWPPVTTCRPSMSPRRCSRGVWTGIIGVDAESKRPRQPVAYPDRSDRIRENLVPERTRQVMT